MTKGAERENLSTRPAVTAVNIPTQAAPGRDIGRRLYAGHQFHRFGLEDADSIEFPKIEYHSGVTRQVGSREEQTRMPRHPTHATRPRIMHHAAHRRTVFHFRRRDARELFLGWIESRV